MTAARILKRILRIFFRVVKLALFALIVSAVIYIAYYVISSDRVGDTPLEITEPKTLIADTAPVPVGSKLSALTYNIGFAAYNNEFSFFMDGGESSRAESEKAVYENLAGITGYLGYRHKTDLMLLQEVDEDGTRSHHVNEVAAILKNQQDKWSTYGVNYDSPYLIYPFSLPHGKNRSGLLTVSGYDIKEAERVELAIEPFPKNLVDLERCYTKQVLPTTNEEKSLIVYNLHLSAYSSDGEITNIQLRALLTDMQNEYDSGNYVIAGGDFNRDLLGDSREVFGRQGEDATWAKPFPVGSLSVNFQLCAPDNAPSCRNADTPYDPEKTFVLSVDGFLVSDNIKVMSCKTEDLHFAYSDHNPVRLEFKLKK